MSNVYYVSKFNFEWVEDMNLSFRDLKASHWKSLIAFPCEAIDTIECR